MVIKESKIYSSLRGVVQDATGRPLLNVLVEVFDHPDHLLLEHPSNQKEKAKQRRIAACETGDDGKFCFVKIPKGNYEIRTSLDSGWNVTHVWVRLDPSHRRSGRSGMEIQMQVGK
jgi:protocatechuate 3,4-dioxygenase beta subunit